MLVNIERASMQLVLKYTIGMARGDFIKKYLMISVILIKSYQYMKVDGIMINQMEKENIGFSKVIGHMKVILKMVLLKVKE